MGGATKIPTPTIPLSPSAKSVNGPSGGRSGVGTRAVYALRVRRVVVSMVFVATCACRTASTTPPTAPPTGDPQLPTDVQACARRDELVRKWYAERSTVISDDADPDCERRLARVAAFATPAHDCIVRCDTLSESMVVDDACRKQCPPIPAGVWLRRLDDPDEGPRPGAANDPATVIARNRWRFKGCYTAAFALDAKAGGTVKVAVSLDPTGKPSASIAASDTKPPALADCVAESFLFMRFSPPAAGEQASFVVPVVLSLEGITPP